MNPQTLTPPDNRALPDSAFRELDPEELALFAWYAYHNDPPRGQWGICHPVCRIVWVWRGVIQ